MGAAEINILSFLLVYLLLIVVLVIMKKCKISKTKQLVVASVRMTIQLVIAGLILTYIFKNPHPAFTVLYLAVMDAFAIYRILSKNKWLNKRFRLAVAGSLTLAGVLLVLFFVCVVAGQSPFNPQYVIPLSGMVFGNAMTGLSLSLKTFRDNLTDQKEKITVLTNLGAEPKKILLPFVNNALETALLPTLNTMLGMGIVALPGMMTGQILSGTLPTTAILYQIAIMITICCAVCLSVFCALYFGYKTLCSAKGIIEI